MPDVMHVDDTWHLVQNVIVDGGDVKSRGAQLLHDRREFVLQENQVAHDHRVIVIPGERCPGAKCQSWLKVDDANRYMKVGAGKTQSVDIASFLVRAAHRLVNFCRMQALGRQDYGSGQENGKNQDS